MALQKRAATLLKFAASPHRDSNRFRLRFASGLFAHGLEIRSLKITTRGWMT